MTALEGKGVVAEFGSFGYGMVNERRTALHERRREALCQNGMARGAQRE